MKGGVWRIALLGHEADLRDASLMFDSAELRVLQTDNEYFLESCRFELITEATEVKAVGVDLLRLANGIARMKSKAFDGLSLSYLVKDNQDGTEQIHGELYTEVRLLPVERGVLSDGTPISPDLPYTVTKSVAAADQDDAILRALTIYGELGDSWRGLHMVLDAIQQDVGGEDELLDNG